MKPLVSIMPLGLSIYLASVSYADIPVEPVWQSDGYSMAVAVRDNYAYADLGPELVVLDVSEPASPTPVWRGPEYAGVHGLLIDANDMYVASDAGLQVFDITDPSCPILVGAYRTAGPYASDVDVSGTYAYVAAGFWGGLTIVDISDPAAPAEVGAYRTGEAVDAIVAVAVSGAYAYVGADHASFQVIDVSDPSAPALVGRCDTMGFAGDIALTGSCACVAAGNGGLQLIDVSDPSAPVVVGSHNALSYAHGVAVSGKWAYVADGLAGLHIFDISNPAKPVWQGGYDTEGYAHSVAVSGSYVYVADGQGGLAILRASWRGDLAPPDGDVDGSDFARLALRWLEAGCTGPEGCDGADLNNDTHVDLADLSIMAANWRQWQPPGPPPPPPLKR